MSVLSKMADALADNNFMGRYGDDIAKVGAQESAQAMNKLLTKRGNSDMLYDALKANVGENGSRIFMEYGGKSADGKKMLANILTDTDTPPELVGYHSVGTDKLKKALDNFGGDIVNPSLQIVNPATNAGKSYGDVVLLGNKDMYFDQGRYGILNTGGNTNVYSRDIYSPRVPNAVEKNGRKFIEGTRKEYTPQNVSDFMRKQGTKAVESAYATPGSIAATRAVRYGNLSEILEDANKLGTPGANKEAFDNFSDFLYDKMKEIAGRRGLLEGRDNIYSTIDDITNEVEMALKGKYLPDDFYGLRTPEGQATLSEIRDAISKLPTDYFEAKATRPINLNEFSGAILPNGYNDETVLEALRSSGVPVLGNYDPANYNESLGETLRGLTKGKNRFKTPYMLGAAGLLGGGSALASMMGDTQPNDTI